MEFSICATHRKETDFLVANKVVSRLYSKFLLLQITNWFIALLCVDRVTMFQALVV